MEQPKKQLLTKDLCNKTHFSRGNNEIMDRFMISMSMGYPDFESELAMAMARAEMERLPRLAGLVEENPLKTLDEKMTWGKRMVFRYLSHYWYG